MSAVRTFTSIYSNPSLTWNDLSFLRQHTKLPILLKGILHPDDAAKAIDFGMDGIIVSNHGGRQVDGSISTIDALPAIAKRVDQKIPVLIDGGIRGGADIFKSIALGATAACIGRPYVYGLALAGSDGVREVLQNFLTEFYLTMGLAGYNSVNEITRDESKIKPIFTANGVPKELFWLAEIESGFNPKARNPSGAVGMYQLMPKTAKSLGLSTFPFDERKNPEKCAAAAARHLHDLFGQFNDWPLTIAAYNAGAGRVKSKLDGRKTKTFDAIASKLPSETQLYVPKLNALLQLREGITLETLTKPA